MKGNDIILEQSGNTKQLHAIFRRGNHKYFLSFYCATYYLSLYLLIYFIDALFIRHGFW